MFLIDRDAKASGSSVPTEEASNVIVIDDDEDEGRKGLEEERRFSVGLAFGQLLAACELQVSTHEEQDGQERLAAEIVPIEYAKEREGAS